MTTNASLTVLNQLYALLTQLSAEEYTQKLPVLNGSTIGQHVRHTIEFFQCLFEGAHIGIIDYDARKRNLQLESNLSYTLRVINEVESSIHAVPNRPFPLKMRVHFDEDFFELIETNFGRELVYMIEHTIHHFALIRVGIQENFKHILLEPTFGVAYSTIRHHQELSISQ